MRLFGNASAILIGLIVGIAGFMIYHQQTSLPLADVMSTQTDIIIGEISYEINESQLHIYNNTNTLKGRLQFIIVYDPITIKLLPDQITTPYEYSFDDAPGALTVWIEDEITPQLIISIPIQGDTENISITSPLLQEGDMSRSLSLSRQ